MRYVLYIHKLIANHPNVITPTTSAGMDELSIRYDYAEGFDPLDCMRGVEQEVLTEFDSDFSDSDHIDVMTSTIRGVLNAYVPVDEGQRLRIAIARKRHYD